MKSPGISRWRLICRVGAGAAALALLLTSGAPSNGLGPTSVSADGQPSVHGVLGTAFTDFGTGHWQHWYQVLQVGAAVTGVIREYYVDDSGIDTRLTIVVNCLETDDSTKEAWMGGEVIRVDGNWPTVGTTVVYYVDDNHGTGQPDIHGGIYTGPEWGEPDYKCTDRPAPWYPDPSQRGRVRVF